jgi:rhodanese-related sulfurtransferase
MSARIDAPTARQLIADGAQLADVLPASVYAQEHLPGAVNMPLESLEPEGVEFLDRTAPLVVYCHDQH